MLGKTIRSSRKDYLLNVDVTTSTFKEHNSFDFESTTHDLKEVTSSHFKFSLSIKYIFIFRNELSNFLLKQHFKLALQKQTLCL